MLGSTYNGAGASGLSTGTYRGGGLPISFFAGNTNDNLYHVLQLSHRKTLNQPLGSIHMHYIPLTATTGNAVFEVYYAWINPMNQELVADANWTRISPKITITDVAGAANANVFKTRIVNLGVAIQPPANEGYSSLMFIRVYRPAQADADDTYTGNIWPTYVDLHYPTDRDGSVYEYSDYPPGTI